MLFQKALALTVSALVCLTVFAPLGISAASEPVHTVYRLPEYAEKAKASNATAEDAKKFVQGVDWGHVFGDSDGGVNEPALLGRIKRGCGKEADLHGPA